MLTERNETRADGERLISNLDLNGVGKRGAAAALEQRCFVGLKFEQIQKSKVTPPHACKLKVSTGCVALPVYSMLHYCFDFLLYSYG